MPRESITNSIRRVFCDHCHNWTASLENRKVVLDIAHIQKEFCSYQCKSQYLESKFETMLHCFEDIYNISSGFVEGEDESEASDKEEDDDEPSTPGSENSEIDREPGTPTNNEPDGRRVAFNFHLSQDTPHE